METIRMDKAKRRFNLERRQFSDVKHMPERRSEEERRSRLDRRRGMRSGRRKEVLKPIYGF